MMRPNKAAAADGRPGGGLGCGDDGGGSLVGAAGRPVGGFGGRRGRRCNCRRRYR